jgi:hypothetical protein
MAKFSFLLLFCRDHVAALCPEVGLFSAYTTALIKVSNSNEVYI